jgi:imidazole glycerol-phosphate synthase subunit HisF
MLRARVIPCLLLKCSGLVKTVRFADPKYVGDPINAVKLFNDLEVDELVILDITATREGREPAYERIGEIASEAFMPIAYGGGIRTAAQAERLFKQGVEKIVVTTAAAERPQLLTEIAGAFGSQSVVAGIDVKRNWLGRTRAYLASRARDTGQDPVALAATAVAHGAGEIFLNAIDRDGSMKGYDLPLVSEVAKALSVPVVACGGAGSLADIRAVIGAGASGAAAGSLFVFKGPHRAVLINYPKQAELERALVGDANVPALVKS